MDGSHPSLVPCDLSDRAIDYWMSEARNESDFQLFQGVHAKGAPFPYDQMLEDQVRGNEDLRMREYIYWMGNLLKWCMLYDEVPPPSSWVWSFFSDGKRWSVYVADHGSDVVRIATKKYARCN